MTSQALAVSSSFSLFAAHSSSELGEFCSSLSKGNSTIIVYMVTVLAEVYMVFRVGAECCIQFALLFLHAFH